MESWARDPESPPRHGYYLVLRRQRLVPLQQLRLPRLGRDLDALDERVLRRRGEVERIAAPDHDVRYLSSLEAAVARVHSHRTGGLQGDREQGVVPLHPVPHRVARREAEIAVVASIRLDQDDRDACFTQ